MDENCNVEGPKKMTKHSIEQLTTITKERPETPPSKRVNINWDMDHEKNAGTRRKSGEKSISYTEMIARAIFATSKNMSTLQDIYGFLEAKYPVLQSRAKSWRNSVRHTLSLNECFTKIPRVNNGKCCFWSVHPVYLRRFQNGDFQKQRKNGISKYHTFNRRYQETPPNWPNFYAMERRYDADSSPDVYKSWFAPYRPPEEVQYHQILHHGFNMSPNNIQPSSYGYMYPPPPTYAPPLLRAIPTQIETNGYAEKLSPLPDQSSKPSYPQFKGLENTDMTLSRQNKETTKTLKDASSFKLLSPSENTKNFTWDMRHKQKTDFEFTPFGHHEAPLYQNHFYSASMSGGSHSSPSTPQFDPTLLKQQRYYNASAAELSHRIYLSASPNNGFSTPCFDNYKDQRSVKS